MDTIVQKIESVLASTFQRRYVLSLLNHYTNAVEGYCRRDWDTALSKAGKFVEATLKALCSFTGNEVPAGTRFKVDTVIIRLEQTPGLTDRSIKLTIPRACRFLYDVVSNRGARHDSDEFAPSKTDASVVIPTISWILAELLRLANEDASNSEEVKALIDQITAKKNPIFETINGRTYINQPGLSPSKTAILLLYKAYPRRIIRSDLADQIKKNHNSSSRNAISISITRLKDMVDENRDGMLLRQNGREQAEILIASISNGSLQSTN